MHVAEAAQEGLADLYAEGLQLEEILQYERQQLEEMELQAEIDEMERLVALERHQLYEATIKSVEEANAKERKAWAKRNSKGLMIAREGMETKTKKPKVALKDTDAKEPTVANTLEETIAKEPTVAHTLEETIAKEPTVAHTLEETVAKEPTVAHTPEETVAKEPTVAHTPEETVAKEPTVAHSLEEPIIALVPQASRERVAKKSRVSEAEANSARSGVMDAEKIAETALCVPEQRDAGRLATS